MHRSIALRAAAVVAAVGLISAPTVGSAFATNGGNYTLQLHQAKDLPITAGGFQEHEKNCAGVPAAQDGWHFVLSTNDASFVKLTVTFQPGGQQVITTFGPPSDKHAYVASAKGAKLTSAVAEVTGGDSKKVNFNLSHTCPASATETSPSPKPSESPLESPKPSESPETSESPSPSESASPSESPAESPSESTSASASPSVSASGAAVSPSASPSEGPAGDSLAFTGASVVGTTVAGLALVGAGGVLVARRRRRGAHR